MKKLIMKNVQVKHSDRTGQHSHVMVPHTDEEQMLEVRGLLEHQLYEFWVTAASAAGEGEMSAIVARKPTARGERRLSCHIM